MSDLDKFGEFFVQNFRDKALQNLQFLFEQKWKAPSLQDLQGRLAALREAERDLVYELVDDILTTAMHDLLFAIQESHDFGEGIEVLVDGKPVAGLSDGLHGEIFCDNGWIKRFSKYPYTERV